MWYDISAMLTHSMTWLWCLLIMILLLSSLLSSPLCSLALSPLPLCFLAQLWVPQTKCISGDWYDSGGDMAKKWWYTYQHLVSHESHHTVSPQTGTYLGSRHILYIFFKTCRICKSICMVTISFPEKEICLCSRLLIGWPKRIYYPNIFFCIFSVF